jgi:hypothetical protein
MNLISDNTLIGSSDIIPGVKNTVLPKSLKEFVKPDACMPVEF